MKTRHIIRAIGATTLLGLAACDGPDTMASREAAMPSPAASAETLELPTELKIDPALLQSGRVSVAPAMAQGAASGLRVPGEVVSSPDGAAEVGVLVGGRVASLEANVGDSVKKGQVLAWLDSPEVGVTRADLARASAAKELAKARVDRQEILQKDGATSQAQIDSANAALRVAQADYSSAALRLSALGATGGSGARYRIVAPITGVVTERSAVLGAAVRPEQMLFRVIAPERMLIIARFPESDSVPEADTLVRVAPRGASAGAECDARVETSSRVVDPRTRTILVRLRPGDGCAALRPGSYVEVRPSAPESDRASKANAKESGATEASAAAGAPSMPMPSGSVRVPAQAVVYVRGNPTVFVAQEAPGHFQARRVRLRSIDGDVAVVEEGVSMAEHVVVQGTILLKGEMLRDVLGGE